MAQWYNNRKRFLYRASSRAARRRISIVRRLSPRGAAGRGDGSYV